MKNILAILVSLALCGATWGQPTPAQGVGRIVAGTNVTISPTSGTGGAVTINATGGGGGGTPGGSDTQLQYNNAGSFGGISGATTNGTVVTLTSPLFVTAASPSANDGAALGTTSLSWSDLFLATGGVINFANGNWVATHTSGILTVGTGDLRVTTAGTNAASVVTVGGSQTLTGKVLTSATITTGITPTTNDGAALGSTSNQFSDLFLAEGGVINWDNGDATLTQSGNTVTLAGAALAADLGTSTATTASAGANSTLVATTAYTDTAAKSAFLGTYPSPDTTGGAVTLTQGVTTIWTNTTTTYTLPAVASSTGKAVIFYVVGTNLVTIDPNASEIIVRAGTAQTGGVTMTLTGAAGNYVCLICDGARWVTLGYVGTLAAGS